MVKEKHRDQSLWWWWGKELGMENRGQEKELERISFNTSHGISLLLLSQISTSFPHGGASYWRSQRKTHWICMARGRWRVLVKHNLNKITVDWPPCPASPSEDEGENAARLLWSLSSRGQRAGVIFLVGNVARMLLLTFGRGHGEQWRNHRRRTVTR